MFRNKSFVSLYILPDYLLLIYLSKDKRKVLVNAKLELPKGIIKNYKVSDPLLFAKFLEAIWVKYRIHEKSIAIIIPEFAAFTKLITLPSLRVTEMQEAIMWQAQEYIPHEIDEILLDWKIVTQKNEKTEVFLVAIKKDILLSFVEAIEKAGMYPLFVEIPSLSLTRLGTVTEGGALFVYRGDGESIVVLTIEGRIIASSVVRGKNTSDILSVIKKITTHYKDIAISVLFSGGGNETFTKELERACGKPVKQLETSVKNLSADTISEFLLPISLSTANLTFPSDPFSINLLPSFLVEKYQSRKNRVQLWGLILTVTLFVWISLFAALGTYLYISQTAVFLTQKNATKSDVSGKRDNALALAREINTTSAKVSAIKKVTIIPQELLNLIDMSRPVGITITSYKIDFDLGEIKLVGVARDRASLIEFKQILEKNGDLENVQIPISNFEVEVNLPFELSAGYVPITKNLPKKK